MLRALSYFLTFSGGTLMGVFLICALQCGRDHSE
ncbi:DUF3789 domain-containing protein [Clostridioides difficile]|nr:DUF3789 domain-containing protein [Clostridioides difficile]